MNHSNFGRPQPDDVRALKIVYSLASTYRRTAMVFASTSSIIVLILVDAPKKYQPGCGVESLLGKCI